MNSMWRMPEEAVDEHRRLIVRVCSVPLFVEDFGVPERRVKSLYLNQSSLEVHLFELKQMLYLVFSFDTLFCDD
jgi:hypothetical protein